MARKITMLLFAFYAFPIMAQSPWDGYLLIDGMDDYAQTEDHMELDIGDDMGENLTVEAWVNFTEFSDAKIVFKKNAYMLYSIDDGSFRGLGFLLNPIGMVATTSVDFLGGGFWEPGWHHVAGVFDQNKGELSIYLDGDKLHSWVSGEHIIANSSEPVQIGVDLNGEIDEVRISSSIRYDSTFILPTEPFTHDDDSRALWHFDENSGSTKCSDASGHDNILTCVGDAQINVTTALESINRFDGILLHQNSPNPFAFETSISFSLFKGGMVRLKILDMGSKEIETILEGYLPQGNYVQQWVAQGLTPGVYICRLEVDQRSQNRRIILTR